MSATICYRLHSATKRRTVTLDDHHPSRRPGRPGHPAAPHPARGHGSLARGHPGGVPRRILRPRGAEPGRAAGSDAGQRPGELWARRRVHDEPARGRADHLRAVGPGAVRRRRPHPRRPPHPGRPGRSRPGTHRRPRPAAPRPAGLGRRRAHRARAPAGPSHPRLDRGHRPRPGKDLMTTAVPTDQTGPAASEAAAPMTHREVLEALSGLLIGMFVAMLSSTVVTNALPTIIGDLGGGESAYTWVITATLLTTTATTPIWGKLADLFSRKMLVQVALVIFVAGSAMAGLAPGIGWLIGARAVQGIGVGGLTALVQVVMAAMIAPRERGRYSGYLGATFALATLSGPLLGGLIVDTSWLGWRWCFFVGAPFALLAFIVLQKTLHLPVVRREGVSIDYLGATLIVGGVSTLLIWVSLAGHQFAWGSAATVLMVGGGLLLLALAVWVESRAK